MHTYQADLFIYGTAVISKCMHDARKHASHWLRLCDPVGDHQQAVSHCCEQVQED